MGEDKLASEALQRAWDPTPSGLGGEGTAQTARAVGAQTAGGQHRGTYVAVACRIGMTDGCMLRYEDDGQRA